MFIKNYFPTNNDQIRFGISTALALSIAVVLLLGLIPVYDPEAELTKFNLKESDGSIEVELNMINKNRFRGFNYTSGGWIQYFYLPDGDVTGLTYEYITFNYHGFKKTMVATFKPTVALTEAEFASLKKQESYIYVSLYVKYWYKILLWTTQTDYYQWLEANVYLNDGLKLKDGTVPFKRIQNLTLAISS